MNWDDMAVVGTIARPHGLRGQVVVNVETDFPEERFRAGSKLFMHRGGVVEPVTVTTVRFHQGRPIVSLAGIDSVDVAQGLAGRELRVPAAELAPLDEGTFYRHDLIGCRVETSGGDAVGVVKNVEGTLNVSRLVVDSGGDEILIPLTAAICTGIDANGKRIVIEPPEGLLELNVNHKMNHKDHKVHQEE